MMMPAALPPSAFASLGVGTVGNVGNLGFEDCESVCQLQLMRLVHQSTAAAGWLAYYPTPQQRQVVQAIPSGEGAVTMPDGRTLTAEAFVNRMFQQATEVQRDVWAFCQRQGQGWIDGISFRLPPSADWAYLLLWFPDASGTDALGNPLDSRPAPHLLPDLLPRYLAEVATLQVALRLDQEHQHQRQQVSHYQHILRRLEHQLRHPLAMIHLYAANLQNGLTQAQDRQQAQTIRDAVGHLSDQLTALIAGCQRDQVQAEVCSVPNLWAEAWHGLRLMAQAKQVDLVLADRPLQILADRAQLIQVFTNLLHNALCFSPPQGQIFAQWQTFQREAVITLADQGPGLSPTDLQQMFRPYYSNRPQGSGLGLTIARQMVQQHGGKLWAENLPQGGAQFSMVLPLSLP